MDHVMAAELEQALWLLDQPLQEFPWQDHAWASDVIEAWRAPDLVSGLTH